MPKRPLSLALLLSMSAAPADASLPTNIFSKMWKYTLPLIGGYYLVNRHDVLAQAKAPNHKDTTSIHNPTATPLTQPIDTTLQTAAAQPIVSNITPQDLQAVYTHTDDLLDHHLPKALPWLAKWDQAFATTDKAPLWGHLHWGLQDQQLQGETQPNTLHCFQYTMAYGQWVAEHHPEALAQLPCIAQLLNALQVIHKKAETLYQHQLPQFLANHDMPAKMYHAESQHKHIPIILRLISHEGSQDLHLTLHHDTSLLTLLFLDDNTVWQASPQKPSTHKQPSARNTLDKAAPNPSLQPNAHTTCLQIANPKLTPLGIPTSYIVLPHSPSRRYILIASCMMPYATKPHKAPLHTLPPPTTSHKTPPDTPHTLSYLEQLCLRCFSTYGI